MKDTYRIIILIVVAIVLVGGIYWLSTVGIGPEKVANIKVGRTNVAPLVNTAVVDLNETSPAETLVDPNPQGTVETNYSTVSMVSENKGKLAFYVTDPANVNLPEQAQANKNKNKNENENANVNEEVNQNKNKNKNINQAQTNANDNVNKAKGNQVELSSLVLTFSKIQVHLAQEAKPSTNTNINVNNANTNTTKELGKDKWEVLNIDATKEIDLIALKNAGSALASLGITDLAAGRYTEIRMYVSLAKAKTIDGQDINLSIPGQNNIIKIVRSFSIEAGQTTELTIDFDALSSVKKADDQYILRPVVGKMIVNGKEIK